MIEDLDAILKPFINPAIAIISSDGETVERHALLAILQRLKEPSEEMIGIGGEIVRSWTYGDHMDDEIADGDRDLAHNCFTAMITAISEKRG